jgi:hypothetical protein
MVERVEWLDGCMVEMLEGLLWQFVALLLEA